MKCQTPKDKYCLILLVWNLKRWDSYKRGLERWLPGAGARGGWQHTGERVGSFAHPRRLGYGALTCSVATVANRPAWYTCDLLSSS